MKEFYGGADKVPFSRMDCNNEIGRERKKYLESNNAQTLLEYLKRKQSEDPTFFYAMQIDKENGQIANFAAGLARGHQWARHLWPTTATTAMAKDDRVYSRDVEVQIHVV